jgi:hypothetical protein
VAEYGAGNGPFADREHRDNVILRTLTSHYGPHVRTHIPPAVKTRKTNARVALLAAGEGCNKCVDFLLIRSLAAGVDARTGGVTDPQYNLVWPRRIVDQHRGRIEGIEIPTLVESKIRHLYKIV